MGADLQQGDKRVRPRRRVGRLEQRLLLHRLERAHHAQRHDQLVVAHALDGRPVRVEAVGGEIGPQRRQQIVPLGQVLRRRLQVALKPA